MEFSNFAIYKFLFYAVLLYAVLRGLKFALPLIFHKRYKKTAQKYFPFAELSIWLVFIAWSLHFFAKKNIAVGIGLFIVLLVIALWASFYYLKDYLAGIVFRTGNDISVNEYIEVNGTAGKITAMKNRLLTLENEQGTVVQFPYSKLVGAEIKKEEHAETISGHTFQLNIPKNKPLIETIGELKNAAINLPWASLKKNPQIKPLQQDEQFYLIELTIFSLEKKFFYNIENNLRKTFE